jgi:hypothetical protein
MIALKSFGELVMRHKGARICVMGGGPSLASDLERVEADIWVSTNEHGAKLRRVDYVFAMDNQHTMLKVLMPTIIRPHTNAPIIGPWQWCDYGLTDYPLSPRLLFTGVVAAWAAGLMGAHPVILAGFDCTGHAKRSIDQFSSYKPFVKAEVRVASGPLVGLWKQYDPDEGFAEYTPPEVFDEIAMVHGVTVRVHKPIEIRGTLYPIGTVLRVPKAEVWRQIKHRSLTEVPGVQAPARVSPVREILTLPKNRKLQQVGASA